jgi:hypothetical protein
MRDFSILKKKILQYLDYKGITKYKFYQDSGVTNSTLSQDNGLSESNLLKILSYYKDLSAEWLLRDEGNMLKATSSPYPTDVTVKEQPAIYNNKEEDQDNLIPVEIIHQPNVRIWDYMCNRNMTHPHTSRLMPRYDFTYEVRSNALFPAIEKGETIYLQRLELSIDSIVNGHTYFIDTKKNGIVIKRVFINENKLECYSLKNKLPVKILSLDDIFDIYNIVALLKYSIDNNMLDNMEEVSKNLIEANREIVQQNTTLINEISAQRNLTEKILDKLNP